MLIEDFIVNRIQELCDKKHISKYRLSQETKIKQSTISNLMTRRSLPNIVTLSRICDGFGITLSEFFQEDDKIVNLSEEQKQVLDVWSTLNEDERKLVKTYVQGIKHL